MITVNQLVFLNEEIEEAEAVSKGSEFHTEMALGKECKNCDEWTCIGMRALELTERLGYDDSVLVRAGASKNKFLFI